MKKKLALITALLLLILSFGACSKDSFMDVYGFTHYYNRITTDDEIAMEDYLIRNSTYSLVLGDEREEVHLALVSGEKGKIEEIRLLAAKVDEEGNKTGISEEKREFFCSRLRELLIAYTLLPESECDAVIKDMKLDNLTSFTSEGELTKTLGDWHTVYYSNGLASVFMIYNIHLRPVEKTEKPLSKPDFGNTAYTRKEE